MKNHKMRPNNPMPNHQNARNVVTTYIINIYNISAISLVAWAIVMTKTNEYAN